MSCLALTEQCPPAQLAADLVNVNRFEKAQLSEVASLVLDLLRDPRGSAFQVPSYIAALKCAGGSLAAVIILPPP